MDHMELPHRHGNNEQLSRLEHCMQEAESFQAVAGLCRLLSDAGRVRIFWLLCHCEECVVNLAAMVGEESETVETVCEPYLVREGFMIRTPKGRVATEKAWQHLGITPKDDVSKLF